MGQVFDTAHFAPLPGWASHDGADRRAGIEIEFGGLDERRAAEIARACLGGEISGEDGGFVLTGSGLGKLAFYLDTRYRKKAESAVARAGLALGRGVIPVEIVTEPLAQADLPRLLDLTRALAEAGATGTRDGVLLGYGLHLNPAIADPDGADVPAVGSAFAFLEPWLRHIDPIDVSRRVLPFTDAYPAAFLDALAGEGETPPLGRFLDLYLRHNPSRNRGLDLLPIALDLEPARYRAALGEITAVSARPAYHYRLPDCRIDEAGWSVASEWNRWALVETVARDADCLAALRTGWAAQNWIEAHALGGWAKRAGGILAAHDHLPKALA